MKKISVLLIVVLICFACESKKIENNRADFVKPPKAVSLNLEDSYALNQNTNDSIVPIINSSGDEVISGEIQTSAIEKWRNDTAHKPFEFLLEAPVDLTVKNNFNKSQSEPIQQWVNNDSVAQYKIPVDSVKICVTELGDTIITGKPQQLIPIVSKAVHPQPLQAGKLKVKDNAFYNLSYFDIEEGLSSSYIYTALQDQRGYYWFGTYGSGIIRFDGVNFTNYTTNEGLAGNTIRSMVEDDDGNIWIATDDNGLCMFDGEQFYTYTLANGFGTKIVYFLTKDNIGNIWAGTDSFGAVKFDGSHFTYYTKNEGLTSNKIWSILQTKDGDYWFANDIKGLSRFDGDTFWNYTPEHGLGAWTVLSMIEGDDGTLWLGTSGGGLTKVLREGEKVGFENYVEENGVAGLTITSITQDDQERIWLTTWGGGILMYDPKIEESGFLNITINEGLTKDKTWFTLQDNNGDYWFGTEGGGVNKLRYPSFVQYSKSSDIPSAVVWDVMRTSKGDLWYSIFSEGLCKMTKDGQKNKISFFERTENFPTHVIISMTEDLEGNLWFATWGYGLFRYSVSEDQNSPKIQQFTEENGISFNYLFTVYAAKNGDIWVGGAKKGVTRLSPTEKGYDFFQYNDENVLGANKVRTITEDNTGNMWFGSDGGGVTCLKQGEDNSVETIIYSTKEGLSSNSVLSIYSDRKNNIWMGTDDDGLMRYDGATFYYYGTEQGLSHLKIRSIVEDDAGNLWVGTSAGLNLLRKTENGEYAITAFSSEDGLKGQDFLLNSSFVDQYNQVWAGTGKGFLNFDASEYELHEETPVVHLTGLEINGAYHDYKNCSDSVLNFSFSDVDTWTNYPKNLELSHESNEVTFQYNAQNGGAQHKLKYQFKLEGNDANWSSVTVENKVDYRGLAPGDYTFLVRAIGESGIWSAPFSYPFRIKPPWWQTTWAYSLYGILVLTCFYFFYRIQLARRLKIQEAEQEIELSKLKTKFFTNISHEFRTPLTLIKGVTDQLMLKVKGTEMQKEVEVLERNSQHLLTTVNQLLDLSKLDARKKTVHIEPVNLVADIQQYSSAYSALIERKGLEFSFVTTHASIVIETDRIAFGQIVQNLIGNAVKFTSKGSVEISIQVDANQNAIVEISDSGIGISPDHIPHVFDRFYQADDNLSRRYEGTGVGLALCKELVELLNGEIHVTSELTEGTTFQLRFPNARLTKIEKVVTVVPEPIIEDVPTTIIDVEIGSTLPVLLIVEDNMDVQFFVQTLLAANYEIITAENGKIGLEMAIQYVPDFIISDWMMPTMTGPEMIQELKQNQITSHIPIMLLTARADQESKLAGYRFGAEAYLTKPFESEELILRIKALVDARNNIRNLYIQNYNNPIADGKAIKEPTIEDLFIEKTLNLILERIDDSDLNGEWLAEKHHLSRSQFARKLKAITNNSITEFIRARRLELAKTLLLKGHQTISEIAYQVGFSDPAYFTRVFTKEIGVSPSDFKSLE